MTIHVVDASVFGPLFFSDEADHQVAVLPQLLELQRCIAPQHWKLEVANLVLVGWRRGRLTDRQLDIAISQIGEIPLAIDTETASRHEEICVLARDHRLTIYDATYLELAIRRGAPLISHDRDLRRAAFAKGIRNLP